MTVSATATANLQVERWVLAASILGSSMAFIPEGAGLASGINNTVSRTASLLSIAVFGIVAYQRFNQALGQRLNALGIPPEVQQLLANERKKLAAANVPPSLPAEVRSAVRAAIESSFVDAFRLVMLLCAALAVGGAACAWLLIGRKDLSRWFHHRGTENTEGSLPNGDFPSRHLGLLIAFGVFTCR